MRSLVVPTSDSEVRQLLRQLEEPITLFGEREVGREGMIGTWKWRLIVVGCVSCLCYSRTRQ